MASTKTYTLTTTGVWTAQAQDSTGTYEASEISNSASNIPRVTVDMTTLSGWSSVTAGSHTLTVKAKASGYITSEASTGVSFLVYSITATATNVTAASGNATTILANLTATLSYTADGTSYKMPTSITVGSTSVPAGTSTVVSGVATFLYTRTSDTAGTVLISAAASNVSFTVEGEAISTIETWIISETPTMSSNPITQTIDFTSNGATYKMFYIYPWGQNHSTESYGLVYWEDTSYESYSQAYTSSSSSWNDSAYRAVVFDSLIDTTSDFGLWMLDNATKLTGQFNVEGNRSYCSYAYQYSVDNGTSWLNIPIGASNWSLTNVTQIKFRVRNYGQSTATLSSTQLGFSITGVSRTDYVETVNYTLTQNITDITCTQA